MKSAFPGFPPEGIAFLRRLKKKNDREWFQPRKNVYEERVRLPMIELVRAVHAEMLRFAPEYVGEPAKCVYRIYRDTRFSKDKTPYKTHVAASFWRNALGKGAGAGYYFSVAPEEIEVGGGLYAPEPETLLRVREHVAENHEAFRKTFAPARIRKVVGDLWGESVSRAPKGFDPAHPAIDLIRRRHFIVLTSLDPALATTPGLFREIVKRFEMAAPFIDFLNRPLLAGRKQMSL